MNIFKIAFNAFPELETNRFILREVKESDFREIYDIYSDEEAVKYQQIKPMETIDQGKKAVSFFKRGYKDKKFIRWCIVSRNDNKVVGLITLHHFDSWNFSGEIGYMLNKKYWKQNIMSEVGEKVIQYAFEVIGLHRIAASIHPNNIGSIKLTTKLGFKVEGMKKEAAYNIRTEKFEDRLIYGIIKKKEK
ncbi:GNAT family N-acetyltransferase [Dethiothermospora halolimnae]|uniref:GNAT family N-acetyltransferase n=1 Tax=Dethiothermospora halolimnae TaxID=3114390 RepID=UPI003CCBB582